MSSFARRNAARLPMKPFLGLLLFCLACRAGAGLPADAFRVPLAADGVQRAAIEGGSYYFRPARLIVKANLPVELAVSVGRSLIPHSFVIQAPEAGIVVDEDLSSEPRRIRFTPTAAGRYPFYCRNRLLFFESHREKGMEGVLEVVE